MWETEKGRRHRPEKRTEPACKPGFVLGNHSSGTNVTIGFKRPTRTQRGQRQGVPIWSCSRRGLPCRRLLPAARCALTAPFHPYRLPEGSLGGLLSVALSVGSHPPGVTWHLALWSPDFPPACIHRPAVARPTPRAHANTSAKPSAFAAVVLYL